MTLASRRGALPAVAAIALAAILPYARTLRNGFTFDDVPIVADSPRLRSIGNVPRLFATDWWGGRTRKSLLYRPLTLATFAADAAIAARGLPVATRIPDERARVFHAHNLLWHAIASIALFALARRLGTAAEAAAAGGLLFAVHPIHSEAVAGIVGRAELLGAALALFALAAVPSAGSKAGMGRAVLTGTLVLASLLSKETAILFAVVLLLMPGRTVRANLPFAISGAVAAAAYVGARVWVLGTLVGNWNPPPGVVDVDNPLSNIGAPLRIVNVLRLAPVLARLLVWPRTLSADYGYAELPLASSFDGRTALGVAILLAAIGAAVACRRRSPTVAFGALLAAATYFPASNVPFPIGTIFGERLLYLPSAGLCLVLAAAYERIPWLGAARAATLAIASLGAMRTLARTADWHDNLTLFAATVKASPRSCKALDSYASALVARGRDEEAWAYSGQALRIFPDYDDAHATMGLISVHMAGRAPKRREQLLREARGHIEAQSRAAATALDDGTAKARAAFAMGSLLLAERRPGEAIATFEECIRAKPDLAAGHVGLGGAHLALAQSEADPEKRAASLDDAVRELRAAIAIEADNAYAYQDLAVAITTQAKLPKNDLAQRLILLGQAIQNERQALSIHERAGSPPAILAEAHVRIGDIEREQGLMQDALAEYRAAASLAPDAPKPSLGTGATLAQLAEREPDAAKKKELIAQAITAFESVLARDPDDADAHVDLGIIYLRQSPDPAKVIEHFRRALELRPDAPQAPLLRAAVRDLEARTAATP